MKKKFHKKHFRCHSAYESCKQNFALYFQSFEFFPFEIDRKKFTVSSDRQSKHLLQNSVSNVCFNMTYTGLPTCRTGRKNIMELIGVGLCL